MLPHRLIRLLAIMLDSLMYTMMMAMDLSVGMMVEELMRLLVLLLIPRLRQRKTICLMSLR